MTQLNTDFDTKREFREAVESGSRPRAKNPDFSNYTGRLTVNGPDRHGKRAPWKAYCNFEAGEVVKVLRK